jgi:hypothetical protein
LDPQAAQHSTSEENLLISNNGNEPIKKLFNADTESRKKVVITECLCDPCPRFYTDIFGSILMECRDPRHTSCDDGGR